MQDWPQKWLYRNDTTATGGVTTTVGEGMRLEKDGSLTYFCLCGAEINRQPGERNDEVQAWVELHNRPFAPLTHIDVNEDAPT